MKTICPVCNKSKANFDCNVKYDGIPVCLDCILEMGW